MIQRDRTAVSKPTILIEKAEDEKNRALEYFKQHKKITGFKYTLYNDDEVKLALKNLFEGKCAYCESHIAAPEGFGDVEHYRPKNEIKKLDGKTIKPGYYWLGADWDNLLPACSSCNKERKQVMKGNKIVTRGKKNWFPVKGEHILDPDQNVYELETPLLLHPCIDDPNKDLVFTSNGAVKPRGGSEKGEQSIKVYALDRGDLVDERRNCVRRIFKELKSIIDDLYSYDKYNDPKYAKNIKRGVKDLFLFQEPKQPYSGMAGQLIPQIVASIRMYASQKLTKSVQDYLEQLIQENEKG